MEALEALGWQPVEDIQPAWYLITRQEWKEAVILGEAAVEPLIAVLNDKDRAVQRGAAWALGEIRDIRAVEPLVTILDYYCYEPVAEALIKIGSEAGEPLMAALNNRDYKARREAATILGRISGARATEPLVAALNVSNDVIGILGEIGDERAVMPLVELTDGVHVAEKAINALEWVLARAAASVAKEALGAVVSLQNVVQEHDIEWRNRYCGSESVGVDCSRVRQLA